MPSGKPAGYDDKVFCVIQPRGEVGRRGKSGFDSPIEAKRAWVMRQRVKGLPRAAKELKASRRKEVMEAPDELIEKLFKSKERCVRFSFKYIPADRVLLKIGE